MARDVPGRHGEELHVRLDDDPGRPRARGPRAVPVARARRTSGYCERPSRARACSMSAWVTPPAEWVT